MKLADLSSDLIERIKGLRYDQILEKHEGPWGWDSVLEYYKPEFMRIAGRDVLLPVGQDQHPNMTAVRVIASEDGKALTLFLKDTTYTSDPELEWFEAGRIAICEKMPGTEFYVATVYHEWFIVENEGLRHG
jgi:hypothetical protein